MQVRTEWQGGMKFFGYDDQNHQIVMESAPAGVLTSGPTPMQLLLEAMATCSGMDVVSILEKRRTKLRKFVILAEGERAESFPKIFTHIKLKYLASGEGVTQKELKRAIDLSVEKYCSVLGIVDKEKTRIDIEYIVE
jgi:putative redox protein